MKSKLFVIIALFLVSFFVHTRAVLGQDVTEVTLEMSPGNYGVIREFKITFRSDGNAFFHGKQSVSLIGKYHGTITKEEFSQLAKLAVTSNFFSLKTGVSSSSASSTSPNMPTIIAPVVITSVKLSNKKQRVIQRQYTADVKVNSPANPPRELLEIESAITNLSMSVKWEKM